MNLTETNHQIKLWKIFSFLIIFTLFHPILTLFPPYLNYFSKLNYFHPGQLTPLFNTILIMFLIGFPVLSYLT